MSAAKVAFLFLRTMAKPVANSVKAYAKKHPRFSENCIAFAQSLHRAEVSLKRKFGDYKVDHLEIRPLTDVRALELGANFIGEATLFCLVATVMLVESTRASRASKRKETEQNTRIAEAMAEATAARHDYANLQEDLDRMKRRLQDFEQQAARKLPQPQSNSWSTSSSPSLPSSSQPLHLPQSTQLVSSERRHWFWFW